MGTETENRLGNTMLSTWDLVAVGVYLVLVFAACVYSMFRPNRNSVAGYFLAGRIITWFPVGASLFASNIGSEHFIGLAGSGAAAGVAVGAFELNALLLLQLLGWVFLPVFIASKVTTLPEYMSKRFGGRRIRTCLAVFSILLYVFTKISVNMYSGGIFLQQALRWQNVYACIVALLLLTALLTGVGGLAAVIYTDTLQFIVMIGGSAVLSVIAISKVGGLGALRTSYLQAIPSPLVPNTTCGLPRHDSWVMLRSADTSVSDMPWPGFLLGQTPSSVWYWCADQMMVQRAMASKSLSHAKGATLFAGIFKLLPLFLLIIPGMVSRVLYTDEVACVDPETCFKFCGSRVSCTNSAYPKLVLELLPGGLRGLMLAVMLSALISDLTSIFNSAATLFTVDLWRYFRPRASVKEQLLSARLFIVLLLLVSVAWVPVIESNQAGEMYIYIQTVAAYLSPPIAAVYCLALLFNRMTEAGSFYGLMTGFLVGTVRMALDFYYGEPSCGEEDHRPTVIKLHYMYFAMLLFWLTVLVSATLSLVTAPVEPWRLIRATFWSRHQVGARQDEKPQEALEDGEGPETKSLVMHVSDEDKETKVVDSETALNEFGSPVKMKSPLSATNGDCVQATGDELEPVTTDLEAGDPAPNGVSSSRRSSTSDDDDCSRRAKKMIARLVRKDSSRQRGFIKPQTTISNSATGATDPAAAAAAASVPLLSTLHQEQWAARLLNTMLVLICLLCGALYVVFSINPFTDEEVDRLQQERLQHMALSNLTLYS